MRVRGLVMSVGAVLALTACESELDKVKADYQFMKRNGAGKAELCRAGDAIVAAALQAKDRYEYQMAQVERDLDCAEARRPG